jgi:hypothetical protein
MAILTLDDLSNERALKQRVADTLHNDFLLKREAWGMDMLEKARIRADFVLLPSMRLIARGFDKCIMALEVKAPLGQGQPWAKLARTIAQSVSYSRSEFNGERPALCLIYPPIATFIENTTYSPVASENNAARLSAKRMAENLAQFTNVGVLELDGEEWRIKVGNSVYFCSREGKGMHNLIKRYSGNINKKAAA